MPKGYYKRPSAESRFWKSVDKNGPIHPVCGQCWQWIGSKFAVTNYGRIKSKGKTISAHRFSYRLHFGYIPEEACVLHRCDNRLCVNPEHLFIGTNLDNMADRDAKGRQAKGNTHGSVTCPGSAKKNPPRGDRHGMRLHPDRAPMGERNGQAKLTDDAVRGIRKRYAARENWRKIAADYGVSKSVVWNVVKRITWKHVQ